MSKSSLTPEIVIGEGVVTAKRGDTYSTANILGTDRDEDGKPITVWLDRLIHSPGESDFGGWRVSGAMSSVLERIPSNETKS